MLDGESIIHALLYVGMIVSGVLFIQALLHTHLSSIIWCFFFCLFLVAWIMD